MGYLKWDGSGGIIAPWIAIKFKGTVVPEEGRYFASHGLGSIPAIDLDIHFMSAPRKFLPRFHFMLALAARRITSFAAPHDDEQTVFGPHSSLTLN